MKSAKFAVSVLLSLPVFSSSTVFAKEKCKPSVAYSEGTWKFGATTLPWKVSGADVQKQTTVVQAASALADILAKAQYESCQALNRLGSKKNKTNEEQQQYLKDVREHSQAILMLATLQSLLIASASNVANGTDEITRWIPNAFDTVQSNTNSKVQQSAKDANLSALINSVRGIVITGVSQTKVQTSDARQSWSLVPKENEPKIVEQLKAVVQLFAPRLKIDDVNLRASIRMHGGDGFLHRPDSWAVVGLNQLQQESTAKLQLYYGAAGVAYGENRERFVVIPKDGDRVTFVFGNEESERTARDILLNPEQRKHVDVKWVISLPIDNKSDQVIAVLDVSSNTIEKTQAELIDAYNDAKGGLEAVLQKIRDLIDPQASISK